MTGEVVERYRAAAQRAGVAVYEELARIVALRSRFLSRAITLDPRLLNEVASDPWLEAVKPPEAYASEADRLDPERLGAELRRWRRREQLRIVVRETITRDLRSAMAELSDLAAAAIDVAFRVLARQMEPRFGPQPCGFSVIGMGKLGGRELNLSSDVDLIYVYEADTDARTHGWFRRLCERLTRLLSEVTADGFVYRVDLGLRPEGRTGAICNSLAAMERYYEAWGHGWERIAWLRARPVAGELALGASLLDALVPFVYRRHLDIAAIAEVRAMKAQIDGAARGRPERDVKLGPGGIREVEFFVQALQLVHAGRRPALRTRDTLEALDRLQLSGLVAERDRDALASAYLFLRAVEHQIQLVDDRQTYEIPSEPDGLAFVAAGLGYADGAALEAQLSAHRSEVVARWEALFGADEDQPDRPLDDLDAVIDEHAVDATWIRLGYPDPAAAADWVDGLRRHPRSPLHPQRRVADRAVARALLEEIGTVADRRQALALLCELSRALPRTTGQWDFLRAHPRRLRALVQLLGTSRYLGELVARDPSLLEYVVLGDAGPAERQREHLRRAFAEVPEDTERALMRLRHLHNAELLRVGFYDVAGVLDAAAVELQLTELAEEAIAAVLRNARGALEARRGPLRGSLCVVGFGRLGAGEMIYGSDIDILFLYEGDSAACSRLCHRLINGLCLPMMSGRLYEVDIRLRPSGNQGPLLVTADSLLRHHRERAAAWEQLALLRARPVAGDPVVGRAVERAIAAVLERSWDESALVADVGRVRQRLAVEVAREDTAHVDLKLGRGGLVEVDLIVQSRRLLLGTHPLNPPRAMGTLEALSMLESAGALSPAEALGLGDAFRHLRKLESRLRIAYGRSVHRLKRAGPAAELLARRLGVTGVPGREGAAAVMDAYDRHCGVVRSIYERFFGA